MAEHLNFYDRYCMAHFEKHEKKIDALDDKVDALITKVDNGIVKEVKNLHKVMWLICGGVLAKIALDFFIK